MLSRQSANLLYLLSKNEISTLDTLSNKLGVSKKTVINALDELEHYLKGVSNCNIRLIRKSGEGIRLVDEFHDMNVVLIDLLQNQQKEILGFDNGRYIKEIMILLESNDYISLQKLADLMYTSKGTVINDLPYLEKILELYHIRILRTRNRGICLKGKETDIRSVFSDIINGKWDQAPIQEYSFGSINSLYCLFDKEIVDDVNELISQMITQNVELSNIQTSAILVHVMIAIQRIQKKESIQIPMEDLENLKNNSYYRICKDLTSKIEKRIRIHFSEEEICYLTLHLMCSKRLLNEETITNGLYEEVDEELQKMVFEIIESISLYTNTPTQDDQNLINGLMLHLSPALQRVKNNLKINNPYLNEMKRNYFKSFDIAIKISEILLDKYHVIFDEHEIAYIAMHIQAHLERYACKNRKKIAVVCVSGVGSSQLMLVKLKKIFDQNVDFESVSLLDIKKAENQKKYDLIFSMIPLELERKVIFVNPFMSELQLQKLSGLVSNKGKNQRYTNQQDIFKKEFIHIENKKTQKDDVIKKICKKLCECNYVTEDFEFAVLKREEFATTAYGQFAIPHGDVSKVLKSCIYIWVNKMGITWEKDNVNVVFLIALNKEDNSRFDDIFTRLYEMISNKQILNQIISSNTEIEILNVIENMSKSK